MKCHFKTFEFEFATAVFSGQFGAFLSRPPSNVLPETTFIAALPSLKLSQNRKYFPFKVFLPRSVVLPLSL